MCPGSNPGGSKIMSNFFEIKMEMVLERYRSIEKELSNESITQNPQALSKLGKERSVLSPVYDKIQNYKDSVIHLKEIQEQLKCENEADLTELLNEEANELQQNIINLKKNILIEILPKDENTGKNIYLEIRLGTGGDESALFAKDLLKMYTKFLDLESMPFEITSIQITGLDGVKEAIIFVKHKKAYSTLHLEAGTHRVQRVPATESSGRIHTSACTIAIIPEVQEEELNIQNKDLKIDVFRSSGPGGQSVNTTDSAIRITHLPTNIIVTCQDEKSQHKNKAKAMSILRARIKASEMAEQHEKQSQMKKSQVGSGDRSEKVRTYNFPQSRVTDHRIKYTSHNLERILEGELQDIIDRLLEYEQELLLADMEA